MKYIQHFAKTTVSLFPFSYSATARYARIILFRDLRQFGFIGCFDWIILMSHKMVCIIKGLVRDVFFTADSCSVQRQPKLSNPAK